MSLSPASAEPGEALSSYQSSWQAIESLVHQGKSWSGRERHCAFLNLGPKRMANISAISGLDFPEDGRALAVTDWDRDGDLDLWLGHRTGPRLRLMLNQTGQTPSAPSHISFQLQGTQCNRDAIGARLTLHLTDGSQQIQSVQAGDAYLSQSSGILHFGLGQTTGVLKVSIDWPGGEVETFTGAQLNHRHLAVQGQGHLTSRPASLIKPSTPIPSGSPSISSSYKTSFRSILSHPIPMPGLDYTPWNHGPEELPRSSRPLLINLWASWCGPCLVELRQFTEQKATFHQAGLDMLALNVDGLDPRKGGSEAAARRLLERMNFPFASGSAKVRWLEKMDLLGDLLFDQHVELAVPTSFLLDTNHNLSAIYRGPLEMETLQKDLKQLHAHDQARRQTAIPYTGRWARQPGPPLYQRMAAPFQERYPEEAERYLQKALQGQNPSSSSATSVAETPSIQEKESLQLGVIMAQLRQGKVDQATETLRTLMMSNPALPDAWLIFAEIARLRQRPVEAEIAYRKALELDPTLHDVANRLALMLATHPNPETRNGVEAVALAQRACQDTDDKIPEYLDTLAAAYAENGQFDLAVTTMNKAIQLAPATGKDSSTLEMEKRLRLYQQKRPYRNRQKDRIEP